MNQYAKLQAMTRQFTALCAAALLAQASAQAPAAQPQPQSEPQQLAPKVATQETATPVTKAPALLLPASELLGLATLQPENSGQSYRLTPNRGEGISVPATQIWKSASGELLVPASLLRDAGCLLYPTEGVVTVQCGRVSLGIRPV